MKRRAILRKFLLIQLCLLAMVAITYSWFMSERFEGGSIQYSKKLAVADAGIKELTNFYGTVNEGTVVYTAITEEGFSLAGAYPGYRQYFRTDIKNDGTADAIRSLYLEGVRYPLALEEGLRVVTTSPAAASVIIGGTLSEDGTAYMADGIQLISRVTLPAGESTSIYWYVEFDEDIPNEGTDAVVTIEKMSSMYNN